MRACLLLACAVGGATSAVLTLHSTHGTRPALNAALSAALGCDGPSPPSTGDACELLAFDRPAFARVFRARSLPYLDSSLRLLSHEEGDAVPSGGLVVRGDGEAAAPVEAAGPEGDACTPGVVILSGDAALDGAALLAGIAAADCGAGRVLAEAAAGDAPPPWAAWAALPVSTQVFGALSLMVLMLAVLGATAKWLPDEPPGVSPHGGAVHKSGSNSKNGASFKAGAQNHAGSDADETHGAVAPSASGVGGAAAEVTDKSVSETAGLLPSPASGAVTDGAAAVLRGRLLHHLLLTLVPFCFALLVNIVVDRLRLFPLLPKLREQGPDVFWGLVLAMVVGCVLSGVTVVEKDGDTLMALRQTEEAKGWMMFLFLFYHFFDVKSVYNLIRVLVSSYVFFTGFGNTISLASKKPTGLKFMSAFLRINLLVAGIALTMGTSWMLYYICALHTLWTGVVYMIAYEGGPRVLASKPLRYGLVFIAITVVWHVPTVFETLFFVARPLILLDGSTYEWFFRSKLDMYSAFVGCLTAEARPWVMAHLSAHDTPSMAALRAALVGAAMLAYNATFLSIVDKRVYNAYHPYTSWIPILGFILLRNVHSSLRKRHSAPLALMGRHSLEMYLGQFHFWLGASAKTNLVLIPTMRALSGVTTTVGFCAFAGIVFKATSSLVLMSSAGLGSAVAGCAAIVVALIAAPWIGGAGAA